jgi:hypothetical protein
LVLCCFLLLSSLKLSPCLVCPSWTLYSLFNITVYMPYSALNNVFLRRALQQFFWFSSTELTVSAHSLLSQPKAVCLAVRCSMLLRTFNNCCIEEEASGYVISMVLYSELSDDKA